jgi:hypothetical protein
MKLSDFYWLPNNLPAPQSGNLKPGSILGPRELRRALIFTMEAVSANTDFSFDFQDLDFHRVPGALER